MLMRGQKLQTSPFFFCIRKTKRENKVLNVTMRLEDDKSPGGSAASAPRQKQRFFSRWRKPL